MLAKIGFIRLFVSALVLFLVGCSFYSDGETLYEGWGAITTIIAPVLVSITAWGILFDMFMSFVFMKTEGASHPPAHYKLMLTLDTVLLVLLFIFWKSFFSQLLSVST